MVKRYRYFSESDFDLIEKAIQRAESQSRGEIVMMLVKSSAFYWENHLIRIVIFLLAGSLFSFLESYFLGFSEVFSHLYRWQLGITSLGLWITSFSEISRKLISQKTLQKKVQLRAIKEFFKQGLTKTKEATGILIFVSEFEKRVQILADSGINAKVDPKTWQKQVNEIVSGVKAKDSGKAVAKAIEEMGELLATHFPTRGENPNELPNRPIH